MSESANSDAQQLAQFGYKQELHRTLGSFSSFAAGFSYISILTGMFQTAALGFFFAGPAACADPARCRYSTGISELIRARSMPSRLRTTRLAM